MKLNAGSGVGKGKNTKYVNIDILKPKKGVQGDILHLPFKDNSFDEVKLIHVLEHVLRHQQVPCLREMYRVLEPGGVFYVEVPDFLSNCNALVEAAKLNDHETVRILTVGTYGKQRAPGDAHHWGYHAPFLRAQLQEVGFQGIEQLLREDQMVSTHYWAEHIILMKATK